MPTHPLEELLHPKSIAVVGSSGHPSSMGYSFTHHLMDYGYRGEIYPVNPNYTEILGLKSYPSIRAIPGSVDFVISCIPASEALGMLEDCSGKRVKAIHLFTARFSETGHPEGVELEQELLARARKWGIRLIGPNCMGVYYPREGISFAYDLPKSPGSVGVIFQTGGGAADLLNLASMRGIGFSKAISYGNALDLDESDYLDYFSQDSETKIILMYVEGVKDGQRFFNTLRRAAASKPIIVIKGGRGKSGAQATLSHTASLAGSIKIWESAIAQAGAISVKNFNEMVDLTVLFQFLPPIRGPRVGIAGGGGGHCVLAADECEEAGLDVIPLPKEIREELRTKVPTIWDWIGNPTDLSILKGFGFTGIDMLKMMAGSQNFDFLIGNIMELPLAGEHDTVSRLRGEVSGFIEVKKMRVKPLMVVLGEKSLCISDYNHWRWKLTGVVRTELLAAGIPFFPTIKRAARAARKVIDYYQKKQRG
jgi:acetyltransferase